MNETPLLPEDELRAYVERHFTIGRTYLEAVDGRKPPFYVLDTTLLKKRARQFKKAFSDALPNVDFYFAVKSNNHPSVAATLIACGFGLDVSSGMEMEVAIVLGAQKIVFSGPGKTRNELLLAVRNALRVTVLIDSFGELERLQEAARDEDTPVRAGVRLSTTPAWQKFGIRPERLDEFCRKADACSHVHLEGVQFHTSWNLSPHAQSEFIERLATVLSALPAEEKKRFRFVDIGGGYWPSEGEWLHSQGNGQRLGSLRYRKPALTIDAFAERLGQAVREHILSVMECSVYLEPGRWICNDAMHLLITVVDRKADDLVITDAGTNAIGWERFETDYFPVLNLTRPAMNERPCHILGSLCTPRDVWGYAYFGEDIREGDILMVPCQGAYTYSLRQNFIKPLPDILIL